MKAITIEGLRKDFDTAEAIEIYDKVADIGGFGVFNDAYRPTLDVSGLSEAKQTKVAELVGKPVEAKDPEEVKVLAAKPRAELEDLAKSLDLDGNSYTNRIELAKAIVQAKTEKEGK